VNPAQSRPVLRWLLAVAGLAGIVAALHLAGTGELATPPVRGFEAWLEATDTVAAALSVVRVLALVVAWYLVVVVALGGLAQLTDRRRLAGFLSRITLPAARRFGSELAGAGLVVSLGLATVPGQAGATPIPIGVDDTQGPVQPGLAPRPQPPTTAPADLPLAALEELPPVDPGAGGISSIVELPPLVGSPPAASTSRPSPANGSAPTADAAELALGAPSAPAPVADLGTTGRVPASTGSAADGVKARPGTFPDVAAVLQPPTGLPGTGLDDPAAPAVHPPPTGDLGPGSDASAVPSTGASPGPAPVPADPAKAVTSPRPAVAAEPGPAGAITTGDPAAAPVTGTAAIVELAPDTGPPSTTMLRDMGAVMPASDPAGVTEEAWTVEPGESFWSIAEEHLTDALGRTPSEKEVTRYWDVVVQANRDRLADGNNPDLLFPGQQLVLPPVSD
jgi:hypothetical protein